MSYSIYIGNVVLKDRYEDLEYDQWSAEVEHVELPDAPFWPNPAPKKGEPSWGDASGKTNGRHPGYSAMSEWAKDVGLYDLWFGEGEEEGLLRPHPGCAILRQKHLEAVIGARVRWEASHPDAAPGWHDGQDPMLARLIWFEWWMTWALKNCERPGVENG